MDDDSLRILDSTKLEEGVTHILHGLFHWGPLDFQDISCGGVVPSVHLTPMFTNLLDVNMAASATFEKPSWKHASCMLELREVLLVNHGDIICLVFFVNENEPLVFSFVDFDGV